MEAIAAFDPRIKATWYLSIVLHASSGDHPSCASAPSEAVLVSCKRTAQSVC